MREETSCWHYMGFSSDLLYAPSYRQNSSYHSLCYTNCEVMSEITQWIHRTEIAQWIHNQGSMQPFLHHERMLYHGMWINAQNNFKGNVMLRANIFMYPQ